jgi:hypothetical protein
MKKILIGAARLPEPFNPNQIKSATEHYVSCCVAD